MTAVVTRGRVPLWPVTSPGVPTISPFRAAQDVWRPTRRGDT